MGNQTVIKNGKDCHGNALEVLIENKLIVKTASSINNPSGAKEVNANEAYILPGAIDDQVHFREPGLTHKADIASESIAAALGGVTTYFEMPNTKPQTVTKEALDDKYDIAARDSAVNYSFYFGGTNDNIEEVKRLERQDCCGLKIFMGSSTGNMLVNNQEALRMHFETYPNVIATHCEDEQTVRANLADRKDKIEPEDHPLIRSEEACYKSSSEAVALAKETGAKLHVLHISTAKELSIFDKGLDIASKQITSEACLHHLFFSDEDYQERGNFIKWNPAVKTKSDRQAIVNAVKVGIIDIIATDHAPHTLEEKQASYRDCPSGGPSIQFFWPLLFSLEIELPDLVRLCCENPAKRFSLKQRGFIKEGYFADLALVKDGSSTVVTKELIASKCKWSPFEGISFPAAVTDTFVNGAHVVANGLYTGLKAGIRAEFNE